MDSGDDVEPIINNVEAGKDWISFVWQVSKEECRKVVSGVWVNMIQFPSLVGDWKVEHFCQANASSQEYITFNTSSTCFLNERLDPCSSYSFEIRLDSNGKRAGQTSEVQKITTPGKDATALVDDIQYGVNWMSFQWKSSVLECQKFVVGYWLNVTNVVDGDSQQNRLPRNCSTESLYEIHFNSSLPCTGLEISPCSNYVVSLIPEYEIEMNVVLTGVEVNTRIGTLSGIYI